MSPCGPRRPVQERAEGDSADGTAEGVTTAEHSLPFLAHDHDDAVRRAGRIRDASGEFFWRLDMQPFSCLKSKAAKWLPLGMTRWMTCSKRWLIPADACCWTA
jgi:hypothetical protein